MTTSYTIPSETGLDAKLTANAAADRARGNHTGTQTADTITDGTTNKAYTAGEKTKLAGIATGATANRADTAVDTLLTAKADLVAGVIPTAQIPALALNTAVTVASQAAMLALTTSQVQPGDVAVRTDGAGTFILTATDPTVLGNWTRLNAPTDVVTTVNGQNGTVVLAKSDIGLSNVDNTADTAKPVSTAQATAIGNTTLNLPVNVMAANGTAVIGARNAVNASAGPVAVTMPTPTAVGQHLIIERTDASAVTANAITITGTIRGTPGTIVTLAAAGAANEGAIYISESLTSWAVAGSIKPKAVLDTYYDAKGAATAAVANLTAITDNGDGSFGVTGPAVTDNGDGTFTFTSGAVETAYTKTKTDALIAAAQAAIVGVNSQTASYTAVLADAGKIITVTSSSATTITVPTNATVGYPVGTVLSVANLSTGAVTIAAAAGVTVSSPAGTRITTQYGQASAVKIGTDLWLLSGQTVV